MKGTRILILMIWLIVCQTAATAQAQQGSHVKLGLRVAPGIGWINPNTEGYKSDGIRGIVSAGLVTDFYFTDNYGISTGFSFLFPSGKMSYRDSLLINNEFIAGDVSAIYKFSYFEIPLMIKMKTNQFGKFAFFGQIGFGTAFRMKATAETEFTPDSTASYSSKLDINNKTRLMRESVIAGIGLEFYIDKSTRLFAGFNYSNSLNNVFKGWNNLYEKDVKGTNNFAELNIGVLF